MRELRFGPAGLPDSKDLQASVDWLVQGGYSACEVQFVKEFTLKEPQAKLLGEMAADAGIRLSVHAPYFAQLTSGDPDRLKLHLGGLHHTCKLASQMGATVVVCHPGSRGDFGPEQLHERVAAALAQLGTKVADLGVRLGLETCGRRSQFGSLGDIALLVKEQPFTTVVVDYGHIHALSNGSLGSVDAMKALFAYITETFAEEHLWPLHTHFSDNRWSDAGELSHVPYGEGTLRISHVLEGASGHDLALTIISEHKSAESHAAVLAEMRAGGSMPTVSEHESHDEAPWFPHPLPLVAKADAHLFRRGQRSVRLTNKDKLLFPDDGITKEHLATYYYNAAPLMMSFLRERPVNMQRVPNGIYGEAFYEKQIPKGAPDWVRTVPVPSDSSARKVIDFVVIDDPATLVWFAQIASVECHAWTSRWPDLDEPDFAVLDLDPHEPIEFFDVKAVARLVYVVLERLGLKGFPKTSGGAGIQVFIPIGPGHTYAEVRTFCSGIGQLLRAAYPEKVTLEAAKPKRVGKVYIDANQNARSKTLVAPYSVRPYPGAPVSTPLSWDELDEEFVPEQFTIKTLFERVERVGDLFRGAMVLKQDLHPALDQIGSA